MFVTLHFRCRQGMKTLQYCEQQSHEMQGGSLTHYYPPDMGGLGLEDTLKGLVCPAVAGRLTAGGRRLEGKCNGGTETVMAAPAPRKQATIQPAAPVVVAPVPVTAPLPVVVPMAATALVGAAPVAVVVSPAVSAAKP